MDEPAQVRTHRRLTRLTRTVIVGAEAVTLEKCSESDVVIAVILHRYYPVTRHADLHLQHHYYYYSTINHHVNIAMINKIISDKTSRQLTKEEGTHWTPRRVLHRK